MPDDEEDGREAARHIHSSIWHLVDAMRPHTLCGEIIEYGWRRRLWAETPEDDRCELCLRQLGA